MTSNEIISKDIEMVASYYNVKPKDYNKFIDAGFKGLDRYKILEVEL